MKGKKTWMVSGLLLLAIVMAGCEDVGFESVDESVCQSGERWASGNEGSNLMHPGRNCVGCHRDVGEGPTFAGAGTVMWNYHEPNDCRGAEGLQVILTGANGSEVTASTNSAGNFFFKNIDIEMPYTARVVAPDGSTLEMTTPQLDTQCANCHTEAGTGGSPGRIIDPALLVTN